MAKAFIDDTNLTNIASAIRAKLGVLTQYLPSQMASAILDIPSGGGGEWEPNWFYVEDVSGEANTLTIKKSNEALAHKVFEWSYDKSTWTEINITDTTGVSIPLAANGKVYLRGDNYTLGTNSTAYIKINCTSAFNIGGDITTLIVSAGGQAMVPQYCFYGLFLGSRVKSCGDVFQKIKILASYSFQRMFRNCSMLIKAPDFPAATLAAYCYSFMYSGCTSLVESPLIISNPTTTDCYSSMFSLCSNLRKITVTATSWNTSYTAGWVNGVAATGDFYNLGGATIPTGTNGIPSEWTEHTSL